ncbi:GNAT family N-acetyltransferase [Bradyrhizobium sp. LA6.12]|uniref:GNAT family N-acetyltransferase n=1 Tax=unclassified Bradyrhizobium TaxID=2631580 RepID=UPI0033946488
MISTRRLLLRKPCLDDAAPIFNGYASDPDVAKFLTWRPHQSVSETKQFLSWLDVKQTEQSLEAYVLTYKDSVGHPIGMIESRLTEHGACLGFVLAKEYWGRGLMTEALEPIVDRAINEKRLWRVYAFCDFQNAASIRVLQKINMSCEGTLRRWAIHPNISIEPRDCYCFARVR